MNAEVLLRSARIQDQYFNQEISDDDRPKPDEGLFLMSWGYLLIAIVCEVAGSTALKKVDGFNNPIPLAIVVFGYGLAIYFLTLTIKTMSLGVTYAIWSGVGIICISILGWIFYKQKLDLAAIIGIGFILAGVIIINLFSKTIHCD